jgi:hypothetical protein
VVEPNYSLPLGVKFSGIMGEAIWMAIDNPGAWLRVSLEAHPHPVAQSCVHSCPCSIQAELPEIMVDAAPRWEIVRTQAPGAATPHDVEDGVKDLAQRIDARTPIGFRTGKMALQASPFGSGEVGRVSLSHAW